MTKDPSEEKPERVIIDLQSYRRKKAEREETGKNEDSAEGNKGGWDIEGMINKLSSHFKHANDVTEEFCQLLAEDQMAAIKRMGSFIKRASHPCPESAYVHAIAGGPCEYNTAPILRAVGDIYSDLDKSARKLALRECLNFLDMQNYPLSQDNVMYIEEPWLASDIVINRQIYWCGFAEYLKLLDETKNWDDLVPKIEKVRSKFWMAMAIARPEYASLDIRTNFMRYLPVLADRTQDAIAAIIYEHALFDDLKEGKPLQEGIESRLPKYDLAWHDAIQRKIGEAKWTILPDAPVKSLQYEKENAELKKPEPKKLRFYEWKCSMGAVHKEVIDDEE